MRAHWFGICDYDQALGQQELLATQLRQTASAGFIMGLEHASVITLGKRGNSAIDVGEDCPIPVVETDRGGQATLHSEGQLVVYPIVSLRDLGINVREYVAGLESITVKTLGHFGISAFAGACPGIFTTKGKIGFIGVRVDRGITRHGLSLNVSNDLGEFQWIRSCGVSAASVDRVCDTDPTLSTQQIFGRWAHEFGLHFARNIEWGLTSDANLVNSPAPNEARS